MDPQARKQSPMSPAISTPAPSATLSDKMRLSDPEAPEARALTMEALARAAATFQAGSAKPTTTGD